MEISPDFSALGLVLTVPLVGYVLVEWLLGKRTHDRMRRNRARDPKALIRMFGIWIATSWACAVIVFAVLATSPGVAASELGITPPDDPSSTLGAFVGLALVLPFLAVFLRRTAGAGRPVQSAVRDMLPRTSTERWYALAMAVTAGICEELVYRGFLIALGVGVLGLGVNTAAALALALFAIGHLYQGWRGVLMLVLVGYALTYAYLSTGSLLLSVGLHIAIDVFAFVVAPMVSGGGERAETDVAPAGS